MEEGTPNDRGGKSYSNDTIKLALLMDIRDELQDLNRLLRCENFLGMPHQLKKIRIAVEARRREERKAKK